MLLTKPKFVWPIVFALIAIGLIVLYERHYKTKTYAWFKLVPKEDSEVFEKMSASEKRGDFEGAEALALEGVDGKPPDDALLNAISVMYFERAQTDSANRAKWVSTAVDYSERALKANPADVVNIYNLGESYATAGMNMSKLDACRYYQKSLDILEHLQTDSVLKGDRMIIEGEDVPTEPYRARLDEKIKQVKMLHRSCR